MPDYGHPLRFATFIGPTNSPPSCPVELAQLSERLGFDFVTFQDHPYQSSYLDTWTLLAWVTARTERIGVSNATSPRANAAQPLIRPSDQQHTP